jgi:FkbM family methyltransferase
MSDRISSDNNKCTDNALTAVLDRLGSIEQRLRELASPTQMRSACYVGNNRVLTVTTRGNRMYVDSRDIAISPGILCWGGWEENTALLLDRFLKPGMIWADVGANCGYFTVIGHKLVRAGGSAGETHAFEVSPMNYRLCVDNLALSWIGEGSHVENIAIYSEERDHLVFQIFEKYGVNSSLGGFVTEEHAVYTGDRPRPTEVRATTLDAYYSKRRPPDFIKIDIEGGEWHALQGARGLIAANHGLRILMEWSPSQLRNCGTEPRALAELIPALGLRCFNAERDMVERSIDNCLEISNTTMLLLCRNVPA